MYILEFTKTDFQITSETREGIIRKADGILTIKNVSLMSLLNDMQLEATYGNDISEKYNSPFENKFTIPFYFINLLLKEHNMKLSEQ